MSSRVGELAGQVAVVTGAAGGIGRAVARALGREGARLVLVGRTQAKLDDVARELSAENIAALVVVCDLTRMDAPQRVVDDAVKGFGRVDILVSAAANFVWSPFLAQTDAELEGTLATNLLAPLRLTQAVARQLVAQGGGGSIVHLASIHGEVGDGRVVGHVASKFGVVGLVRAAAEALREHAIRVNAVAPGSVEPRSADRHGAGPHEKVTQADVAAMVLYLCRAQARSVTGAVFDVHGVTRAGLVER